MKRNQWISFLLTAVMLAGIFPAGAITLPERDEPADTADTTLSVPVRNEPSRDAQPNFYKGDLDEEFGVWEDKRQEYQILFDCFTNANPQLFLLNDEGLRRKAALDTVTEKQLKYIKDLAEEIVADCKTADEKIYTVAVYLAENICYDLDYERQISYYTNYDVYDILKKGYTDTLGFANTFEVMMQLLGFPTSYAKSSYSNWVLVYNGNRWIQVDTAWMANGVRSNGKNIPGDSVDMKWYDFTLEDCMESASHHCPDTLALTVSKAFKEDDNGEYVKDENGHFVYILALTDIPIYTTLSEFVVPDGVGMINFGIFSDCTQFTRIILPDSVTRIEKCAFMNCSGLTEINIPDSVTFIDTFAFAGCSALTEVKLPDSIAYLGGNIFDGCTSLEKAVLPEGTPYITTRMFADCINLSDIDLPEGISSIHGAAFYNCRKLTKIKIPDSVTYMDGDIFYGCDALTDITLGNGLESIDYNAFGGCGGLTNIVLPDSLVTIGDYAFNFCPNLKSVTFGKNVQTIGSNAFSGCNSLESVVLPDSVTTLGESAFASCDQLASVKLGKGLTTIGTRAFEDCRALAEIKIPDSLTSMGEYAFLNCKNLQKVTIGDGLTSIPRYAFEYCSGLKTVKFGKSVTTLEEGAFYNSGLQKISFPEGMTTIGEYAFTACQLKSIVIPTSMTSIGASAFHANNSLETVYYTGTQKQWNKIAIEAENNPLFSAELVCNHVPGTEPPLLTVSNTVTTGKIKLDWEKIDGAAKYEVYRATSKTGTYKLIKTTTSTSFTNTSVTLGKTYYYKVRTILSDGTKSAYSEIVSGTCVLPCPQNVTASIVASTGKVKLTWDKVDGAQAYYVWRAYDEYGKFSVVKTVTDTSWIDIDNDTGVTCYYKVTAKASDYTANSKAEKIVSATVLLPCPNVKASNVSSTGKIKLTWDKINGAKEYEIWRATSKNGTYKLIQTTASTSFTNTSTTAGKTYYYKVKAISDYYYFYYNVDSMFSEIVSRTCDLAQPKVKATNISSTGKIKLTWEKVSGAVKYEVYRATSKSGTYKLIKTTTGTSFTNTSTTAGKTYYYKVKAIASSSSANSAYSEIVSRACDLAQPVISVKLSSKGKPVISWEKVSGAVKYEIYRATSKSGTYTLIKTTTSTSFTNTSTTAGKTYYYKVKAIASKSAANSAYSEIKSIKAK